MREANRRWKAKQTPERLRELQRKAQLQRLYGMTPADYDAMLAEQGGVCRICKEPEQRRRADGTPMVLHVDHDHETGVIRGLLCTRCNTLLGMAYDNTETLRSAIKYLDDARV